MPSTFSKFLSRKHKRVHAKPAPRTQKFRADKIHWWLYSIPTNTQWTVMDTVLENSISLYKSARTYRELLDVVTLWLQGHVVCDLFHEPGVLGNVVAGETELIRGGLIKCTNAGAFTIESNPGHVKNGSPYDPYYFNDYSRAWVQMAVPVLWAIELIKELAAHDYFIDTPVGVYINGHRFGTKDQHVEVYHGVDRDEYLANPAGVTVRDGVLEHVETPIFKSSTLIKPELAAALDEYFCEVTVFNREFGFCDITHNIADALVRANKKIGLPKVLTISYE